MARPSSYNDETAAAILERIAAGESLIEICQAEDMPSDRTVYRWLLDEDNKSFCQEYARARDFQAEHFFEEITEIRRKLRTGDLDPNSARVEIDAIKWQAGKLKPNKYSDKYVHEHQGTVKHEVSASPELKEKLGEIYNGTQS